MVCIKKRKRLSKTAQIGNNMIGIKKSLSHCLIFFGALTLLVACGDGSTSKSSSSSTESDPGTPTTLVTAANGVSTQVCAPNAQCISLLFTKVANVATKLSQASTSWTNTSTNIITIAQTPYVEGAVMASQIDPAGSVFSMTTDDKFLYFKGNGLPSTPMGNYPVQPGTAAYSYYSVLPGGTDPRTGKDYSSAAAIGISPYDLSGKLPLNPVITGFNPINALIIGITLTGAAWHAEIANDSSGNWYSPTNALPNDQCFGHPYAQQYHYHGYSWKCFPNQGTSGHSPLFGYALDGFGIFGPRGVDGKMVTNAELDTCHGHIHPVEWNGSIQNIYHYHLNREYPFSVGCFRGTPDYNAALGSATMQQGVPYSQLPNLAISQ
jgi:hypothetical protein